MSVNTKVFCGKRLKALLPIAIGSHGTARDADRNQLSHKASCLHAAGLIARMIGHG